MGDRHPQHHVASCATLSKKSIHRAGAHGRSSTRTIHEAPRATDTQQRKYTNDSFHTNLHKEWCNAGFAPAVANKGGRKQYTTTITRMTANRTDQPMPGHSATYKTNIAQHDAKLEHPYPRHHKPHYTAPSDKPIHSEMRPVDIQCCNQQSPTNTKYTKQCNTHQTYPIPTRKG